METDSINIERAPAERDTVEMPCSTAAPLTLSVGLALLAAGAVTSVAFLLVAGVLCLIGLGMWIEQLLPQKGHFYELLVAPFLRPSPIIGALGRVEQLREGAPGYRIRMPEKVHPISAGVKGGIFGGLVMPLPALAYGALSGHGIWFPVNLLAGMVLPGLDRMSTHELEQFHFGLAVAAVVIHAVMALVLGMVYGVLMPTLPDIPQPLAWGALLAPMLWTGLSYLLMAAVNPVLNQGIDWPWFIASQFVFGVILALVTMQYDGWRPVRAAVVGASCGALLMPLPAMLWGHFSGRGIWFPVNLLAGMVVPGMDELPAEVLTRFHAPWLLASIGIHFAISLSFGVVFGLVLPVLPRIPGPLAWGGMLLPLIWTGTSYALMGIVNPLLDQQVEWPWFVFSQLVFGIAAAVVVVRSEMMSIAPAGSGPHQSSETFGQ